VLITWTLTTLLAAWLLDFDFQMALLTGAILVVTGPTVIIPLLRQIRPTGRAASILRWEGIVIVPVGVVLTVLVFDCISTDSPNGDMVMILVGILKTIVIGILGGYMAVRLLIEAERRHWIPDYLENPVTLFLVLAAFTLSNLLQAESGLLSVTIMGIVLANQDLQVFGRWHLGGSRQLIHIERIVEFKETLQTLIVSSLFIILSARLRLDDITRLGAGTVVFVLCLILIVRPLTIWICTFRSPLSRAERLFISWMAPRGIVAAATASLFGLELTAQQVDGAEQLVPVIFAVIIITVIVYGLSAGPLAQRLGLSQANPQGALLVGAHCWARAIAQTLKNAGFQVLMVDTNWENVQQARMEGLRVVYANILSSQTDELLDLTGIGRVLALTSNDEVNTLTSLRFVRLFGRAQVYQLPYQQRTGERLATGSDLSGRILFGEGKSYAVLDALFAQGMILKTTRLTPAFDIGHYQSLYNGQSYLLFAIDKMGKLLIATADSPLKPQIGMTLISLVQSNSPLFSADQSISR